LYIHEQEARLLPELLTRGAILATLDQLSRKEPAS